MLIVIKCPLSEFLKNEHLLSQNRNSFHESTSSGFWIYWKMSHDNNNRQVTSCSKQGMLVVKRNSSHATYSGSRVDVAPPCFLCSFGWLHPRCNLFQKYPRRILSVDPLSPLYLRQKQWGLAWTQNPLLYRVKGLGLEEILALDDLSAAVGDADSAYISVGLCVVWFWF